MNFLRRMEKSEDVDDSFKKLLRKKVGGRRGKNFGRRENLTQQKTRKELRKEMRRNKKSVKHTYILNRLGKISQEEEAAAAEKKKKKKRPRKRKNKFQKDEEENVLDLTPLPKKKKGAGDDAEESSAAGNDVVGSSKRIVDAEMEQLKREMEESRRKRLLEENAHEDKFIRKMEKKLKLNKKAKIPASFKTDGLDYLLEICDNMDSKKKKEIKTTAKDSKNKDDDDDSEDFDEDDDMDEDDAENSEDGEDLDEDVEEDAGSGEDVSEDDEEDYDLNSDEDDDEDNAEDKDSADHDSNDDDEEMPSDFSEDDEEDEKAAKKSKKSVQKEKTKAKSEDELWEDIYGRLRRKDGSVVDEKAPQAEAPSKTKVVAESSGKPERYVPPMKRQNQSQKDKITRSLKGLLNRLSEGNMHSISAQIEELYMTNSRNEMNECMLEILYAVLVSKVLMPERVILEHVMLIGILHANIGTEIGAFFIQNFVTDFRNKYEEATDSSDDNKELDNLIQLICAMYQFKIVDACLIYDILNFMANNFTPKDVELILICLRSVGFKLRKDDPIGLKSLIIIIQEKASTSKTEGSSAKVKFMLEIVIAIRNNNMSKIPNYDPEIAAHLQKLIKGHIHKGNYISVMKIKMEDLLNAETRGRWWIVGSAWTNTSSGNKDESSELKQVVSLKDNKLNEKLLAKARALGMNTETRKNIFSILMTAEDYMDAFEKLNHLDLKNNQEREVIHVSTYCCLHEKKYNPYYSYIISKFCSLERKFMITLQYNLWDRLKDLPSLKSFQLNNLAKLLVHLINNKSIPLSTLKVIEYAEMDKVKLKFLKDVLTGILLQKHEENVQEIFLKIAISEKLSMFRESLRLFLCHFMVQKSIVTSDGETITNDLNEKQMELLENRIKLVETTLLVGKERLLL